MKSRYRINYSKNELMRYTSNLDVQKSWERTFRRARVPIAYSQGFHPQPKIQLACPLPLGFLSENEILDFVTEEKLVIPNLETQLAEKIPPGIQINEINEVELNQPSLQVQTRAAQYRMEFLNQLEFSKLSADINLLLRKDNIIRTRRGKTYDLRPLILDLVVFEEESLPKIRITLSALENATGRPEEILDELLIPFQSVRITREKTLLK
ncbi:MAG: TIGR03936 family radical SAM-associated protein [Anaerolineaceae bacterium]